MLRSPSRPVLRSVLPLLGAALLLVAFAIAALLAFTAASHA
jgi:hypothetical protein